MKLSRYVLALFATITLCVTIQAQNLSNEYRNMSKENAGCKRQINALSLKIDIINKQNAAYQKQIDNLTKQITQLQKQMQGKLDRPISRSGDRFTRRIMECTAYWEGSCGKSPDDRFYGITASGERVRDGMVAAGLELKLGTKVYIPFSGRTFIVADRGGMITNGHLDIYLSTRTACFEFGRRKLEVYILGD